MPIVDAPGIGYTSGYRPELFDLGTTLIATPPPTQVIADGGEGSEQLASASLDDGQTWMPLDLPAPRGMKPTIVGASRIADAIVIAGSIEPAAGPPPGQFLRGSDVGLWVSMDGGGTFEEVGEALALDPDRDTGVLRVVSLPDRVVIVTSSLEVPEGSEPTPGTTCGDCTSRTDSFATTDAITWTQLEGNEVLAGSGIDHLPLRSEGGTVEMGDYRAPTRLATGSNTWAREQALPDLGGAFDSKIEATADIVTMPDGSRVATWNMQDACDCSIARYGRIEGPNEEMHDLELDDCDDRSERGMTGVGPPLVVADTLVAVAWCNDENAYVASLATSTDQGKRWTTTRLRSHAPDGTDDLLVAGRDEHVSFDVAVPGGVIIALESKTPGHVGEDDPEADPGPIVLLRVVAA
jgi:hypothetical protein